MQSWQPGRWSSLSLSSTSDSRSCGCSELAELLKGSLLLAIGDGSLLLDDLCSVVRVTTDVDSGDSGVALGLLCFVLLDAVLTSVLQSHSESSFEMLSSLLFLGSDTNGVAGLLSAVESVHGEGRVAPILAHPSGLVGVPFLGESPNYFL